MAEILAIKTAPAAPLPALAGGQSVVFQNWGGNYYTSSRANAGQGVSETNSGYIAAAMRFKIEQFPAAHFAVGERKTNAAGREYLDTIERHPLSDLLRFPCGYGPGATSRSEWLARMICSYEFDGNAYSFIKQHPRYGYAVGLQYLPHWAMQAVRLPGLDRISHYLSTVNRVVTKLLPSQVIHWKQGTDPGNECLGYSPLKSVVLEQMTERESALYAITVMQKLGVAARIVTPKTDATVEAYDWDQTTNDEIKNKLDKAKGEGRGDDVVIGIPLDVQELSASPEKMALDKINLIPKEKILAVLNVNPAVVNLNVGFNQNAGIDQKSIYEVAWKISLLPLGYSLCERLTLDILPQFGDIARQMVKLDTRDVWALQEDLNKLHERWQKSFLANLAEQNEAREALGLEARDGGEKTHNEFPQLINGNAGADADATILNGTNGKLPNETDRAHQTGTVEVAATGDNA